MSRPAARPTASTRVARNRSTGPASGAVRTAKDSASLRPFTRISASRLDLIHASLTDHDQAVLSYVGDMRLATGMQLARRLWSATVPSDTNARAARRTLGRLEQWRVIDRLAQRIGGVRAGSASIVYGLGPAGRRILARSGGMSPRLGIPGDRYVTHTLSITELAVRLHEATLRGELDLIELSSEPACWRRFPGRFGASVVLKPDLSLRIGVGAFEDRWFVEVDRATESTTTITAKAWRYLEHYRSGSEQRTSGVYPRVLWTVPDAKRGEQITQALTRLPGSARRLFVVWVFEEVIGRLGAEAQE